MEGTTSHANDPSPEGARASLPAPCLDCRGSTPHAAAAHFRHAIPARIPAPFQQIERGGLRDLRRNRSFPSTPPRMM